MRVVSGIDPWYITLNSGGKVTVWADGYQQINGLYEFSVLVERDEGESGLANAKVVMKTPSNPKRVALAVMSIPAADVASVSSG